MCGKRACKFALINNFNVQEKVTKRKLTRKACGGCAGRSYCTGKRPAALRKRKRQRADGGEGRAKKQVWQVILTQNVRDFPHGDGQARDQRTRGKSVRGTRAIPSNAVQLHERNRPGCGQNAGSTESATPNCKSNKTN